MQMFVGLFVLILSSFVSGRQDADYFPILKAKCEATCWKNNNKPTGRASWTKPGHCPTLDTIQQTQDEEPEDVFGLACLDACNYDSACQYTDKCCPNSCGVTCQPARDLDRDILLPSRPLNVSIRHPSNSTRKKKASGKGSQTILTWNQDDEDYLSDGSVVYVLEARSHIGFHFSALRLSEWAEWPFTPEVAYDRGFSEPSSQYTLPAGPKPPESPSNVHVEAVKTRGDEAPRWILHWDRPEKSDLPVHRYKVFWSRRISPTAAQGTVFVQHATLPGDVYSYVLKELQPNSQYFMQESGERGEIIIEDINRSVFNQSLIIPNVPSFLCFQERKTEKIHFIVMIKNEQLN
ncbi:hypothetical protein B566_EDAN009288 [Ephemera danica]|nr:hypothetical protein B566_EDAN009288 [Ephemera danica]